MTDEHWDSVVNSFSKIIGNDEHKAIALAREAFHEIARCGNVEHSQSVAESWMRILEPFVGHDIEQGEEQGEEGIDREVEDGSQ